MLLEFKTKNYKSFKEELVFPMIPAPKQKGLDYSILTEQIGKNRYKALSSSVIYGPNASGKTNLIGAMDTFKSIILRGHINNEDNKENPNTAACRLELIPNISNADKPVSFSIKFIEEDLLIEYSLTAGIGEFAESSYNRKIIEEVLTVNEKLVFKRKNDLEIDSLKHIKKYMVNEFDKNKEILIKVAKNNLHDNELFLQNGFKNMFSSKLVTLITNWLDKKLVVILKSNAMQVNYNIDAPKKELIYIDKVIDKAAKEFGINSNALGFKIEGEENKAVLCSLINKDGKTKYIPADIFESYGTMRFVNLFNFILLSFIKGGTIVIDEFDASLHPMALMNIINIFHDNDINIKKAQLIFNTHNPIFLNKNLFRRDEIKFVERDDLTHESTLYSLSDFGTAGKTGVRKDEDYMNNYFIDRYGAIKEVDFKSIVKELMEIKKDDCK
ncbi:MAG: ATP-binding protein [Clostridia bacterium]|jgi:hypothetical protein|nr:ATP-binding protein [Clostridia bacterium]MDD3094493.1 ATP-binding protein [Clostridia bacterium]